MIEKTYFYKKSLGRRNWKRKFLFMQKKKTHNITDRYTVRLIKK